MARVRPAVLAIHALSLAVASAAGQDFVAMDGVGKLYSGDLAGASLALQGTVEAGWVARGVTFCTNENLAYLGNGIEGEVWITNKENTTSSRLLVVRDALPISNYFHAKSIAADGAGRLYVSYLTFEFSEEGAFGEYVAVFDERTGELLHCLPLEHSNGLTLVQHVSMTVADDGMIYSVSYMNDLYRIDPSTGVADWLASVDNGRRHCIGYHEGALYLCASHYGPFSVSRLNPTDWSLDVVGVFAGLGSAVGFEFVSGTPADLSAPYGRLDAADALNFIGAFEERRESADLVPPFGQHDYADVLGFMEAFERGYP